MKLLWRCISGCCGTKDGILLDEDLVWSQSFHSKQVDPEDFESPAEPAYTSGGTAKFYLLKYRDGCVPKGKTKGYWIAKDLAHAVGELDFYEATIRLREREPRSWPILNYMFDYGGQAEFVCRHKGRPMHRKQLVLRNIRDGASSLRLIDIKIGAVTGVGGWHGKSHINAMKNRVKDQTTNSAIEGYRAEGFDGAPPALEDIFATDMLYNTIPGRNGRRVALQRLTGSEVLLYFNKMPADVPHNDVYCKQEVAAFALRQCVRELIGILSSACATPVPQQWIGSSVALAFDVEARPSRSDVDPKLARVNIFDWGRSELTTVDMFSSLNTAQKKARVQHWEKWVEGMLRLSFETARFYRRQFCPAGRWRSVRFKVWSHARNNDLSASPTSGTTMGYVSIPLRETSLREITLQQADSSMFDIGTKMMKKMGQTANAVKSVATMSPKSTARPSIRIQIEGPFQYPVGSCLREGYKIHVLSARNLPKTDVLGWCNPCVDVSLVDAEGAESLQRTAIVRKSAEPVWDEVLIFASASNVGRSAETLLPEQLWKRANSRDVANWELAASSGVTETDTRSALKLFKEQFCYFDGGHQMQDGFLSDDRELTRDVSTPLQVTSAVQTDVTFDQADDLLGRSDGTQQLLEDPRTPRRVAGSTASTPNSDRYAHTHTHLF